MIDNNDNADVATDSPTFIEQFEEKRLRACEALRNTSEWRECSALNQAAHLLGLDPDIDEYDATSAAMEWHALQRALQMPGARRSRANMVEAILTASIAPMTSSELLKTLSNLGHRIPKENDANILAATLTRDSRFASGTGVDGKRRWRLAGDPG